MTFRKQLSSALMIAAQDERYINEKIRLEIQKMEDALVTNALRAYIPARSAFLALAVDELFNKYPILTKFGWKQYTPNWCDGEECSFGVFSIGMRYDGDNDLQEEYEGEYYNEDDADPTGWMEGTSNKFWMSSYADKEASELQLMLRKIEDFVKGFDRSELESMFGCGAIVAVSRSEVKISQYEDSDY